MLRKLPLLAAIPVARIVALFFALAVAVCSGVVSAIETPVISASHTTDGKVQVRLLEPTNASGFNLYIDNNYIKTRRIQPGQSTLLFDTGAGRYCVTGFVEQDGTTAYSACSNTVNIGESGSASNPIAASEIPRNFRFELYSATAAELFWLAPQSAKAGIRYELKRDNQLLTNTDGRSYFESNLEPDRQYVYTLSALDAAGRSSDPVQLTLNTNGNSAASSASTSPVSDMESPTVPGNLRGVYYSATAAELFWERSSDNQGVASYEIKRDGQVLATLDAQSYFESAISDSNRYRYEVVAIDFNGNRSTPATLTLERNVATRSSDQLAIALDTKRYSLQEGDESWLSIPLSIQRAPGNTRAVNLSLQAENQQDGDNVTYLFEPSNLAGDVSGSILFVKLGVGVAPIDFHERRFTLSADDGQGPTNETLVFDVKPVSAPDVYLLIGQSNMEGSSELFAKATNPGEPDELTARIRQLNVQPNSTNIFNEPWRFTDESSNVSSPRYIVAEDPLHEPRAPGQPRKEARFIGLGLSFAKAALPNTTQEIYLVPAAWSATGFCVSIADELGWNAEPTPEPYLSGTLLADRALTRLNMTLRETRGVLRGILWHQGEADSNNYDCAARYEQNLRKLIDRIRTEALVDQRGVGARGVNAAVPLVVGTMSKGNDHRGSFSLFGFTKNIVDEVHRNVASKISFAASSNHDDLVPPAYPCGQGSCIHFGSSAYREMGSRYHDALRRIISR